MLGRWTVHHRKLKERLAGNHEWIEFEGTSDARKLGGGWAIIDDNFLDVPGAAYHGGGLRTFDAATAQWSIWWQDSRMPLGPLDPPVRGVFQDGVGMFYSDDTLNGKPIRVRYTWSGITPTAARWEQAFSPDNGATWETNWLMEFTRVE
jgi:hypothetical protein